MSIFLIGSLSVLLVGAAIVALLAWHRPQVAPLSTGIVLAVALLVWLVAGQNLPLGSPPSDVESAAAISPGYWRVNAPAWQLSFFFLLMMESIVVVSLARYERDDWSQDQSVRQRVVFPAVLLTSAAALLTVWMANIAGLLISWVVLTFAWLLLLWAMTGEQVSAKRLLPRGGAMLLGVLLLWLAVAFSGLEGGSLVLQGTASGRVNMILLMAAMVPLGALPFQWWRPLAWSLPSETAVIAHLAPVVAGGSLLTRLESFTPGQDAAYLLVTTSLGLMGLLVGISIAWMYVASPDRALSGLALAQAGIVVLAAGWVGANGVLAATRILLLGIGGLYLAARWSPRKLPWPAIVPLLALAGFPLTAGYTGLVELYDAWLTNQQSVLLIIGVLLLMFLLAAGILIVRREMPQSDLVEKALSIRARHYLALALPSIGLLALPGSTASDTSLWSWIAVIAAIAGSLVLSRYETRIHDTQLALRRALHLGFAARRLLRLLARVGSGLDSLVREMAAILEGEGGMLWLLVFVIVIWLARR